MHNKKEKTKQSDNATKCTDYMSLTTLVKFTNPFLANYLFKKNFACSRNKQVNSIFVFIQIAFLIRVDQSFMLVTKFM